MSFKMNDEPIKSPSTYAPYFATVSTEDSDRSQTGVAYNTPMFTTHACRLGWENLTDSEISNILQKTVGKSKFSFYWRNPYIGQWETREFYMTNSDMENMKMEYDGQEGRWKSLTFNVIGVNPL